MEMVNHYMNNEAVVNSIIWESLNRLDGDWYSLDLVGKSKHRNTESKQEWLGLWLKCFSGVWSTEDRLWRKKKFDSH